MTHKSLRYETLSVDGWCLTESHIQLADMTEMSSALASFFEIVWTFMASDFFNLKHPRERFGKVVIRSHLLAALSQGHWPIW